MVPNSNVKVPNVNVDGLYQPKKIIDESPHNKFV